MGSSSTTKIVPLFIRLVFVHRKSIVFSVLRKIKVEFYGVCIVGNVVFLLGRYHDYGYE